MPIGKKISNCTDEVLTCDFAELDSIDVISAKGCFSNLAAEAEIFPKAEAAAAHDL